ncbi:MAG TPA: hypothetical protein ENJ95_15590 [Bacteroidetes bacterium]|nr:hypothetical protein [Bacteroidota bacterium]
MRNFIHVSKLVVLLIALSSCTAASVKTETITISGKLTGGVNSGDLSFKQRTGVKEVEIKDNGFKITFSSSHPVLIRFYLKRYQEWEVFARPGDKIEMNFDLVDLINSLNSITYIGDSKNENEFLIKMRNLFKYDTGDQLPFYNCPESSLLNKVDSLKSIASGLWGSYKIKNKNCDPVFEKYIKNYIRYVCAFYINYYPKTYKANFAHPSYKESINFKNKMNSVNIENPELLDHVVYCDYLNYKIAQKAKELMIYTSYGKNKKGYIAFKIKAINDMLKNKEVITYSKFAALYSLFVSKSSEAVDV